MKRNHKYSKQDLIDKIKELTKILGRVPSKKEFLEKSGIGEYYLTMYGGLTKIIVEAGYKPRFPRKPRAARKYTRDDLILAAMITYEEHPDWTTTKIISNTSIPSYHFIREFGSISEIDNAIERRSAKRIRSRFRFSDAELKEKFRIIAFAYPEENNVWRLLEHSKDCASNTFFKRFGAPALNEMLRKIRARQNSPYLKRYPVRHRPMPIILRWISRNPSRPKAV